jgi:hypothetical protein
MLSPNSRSRHLPELRLNVKSRPLTITVLCRCSPTATTKTSNQQTLHTRTSRGTRNGKLEVCSVCSLSPDLSLAQNLLTVVIQKRPSTTFQAVQHSRSPGPSASTHCPNLKAVSSEPRRQTCKAKSISRSIKTMAVSWSRCRVMGISALAPICVRRALRSCLELSCLFHTTTMINILQTV